MSLLVSAVDAACRFTGRLDAGLSILLYHRVRPQPDPLMPGDPTAATFAAQMEALARHANPVSLQEGLARLDDGTLRPRSIVITFDDGYADNATLAAPILQRLGIPATFFVATGFLDGGRMWNDTVIESVRRLPSGEHDCSGFGLGRRTCEDAASRLALSRELVNAIKHREPRERQALADRLAHGLELPADLMMTSGQVRGMADAGFEIGGHTVSHPILARVSPEFARAEIAGGRQRLQEITGKPVRYFAYPNGRPGEDYLPLHATMARELGFDAAVSTRRGLSGRDSDRWQLPRFVPWAEPAHRFLARRLLEFRKASSAGA